MSRTGNHAVHRHGAAHPAAPAPEDSPEATSTTDHRRARWAAAAGLALATAATVAMLAAAQGTVGRSSVVATGDPSQVTATSGSGQATSVGVSSADLGAQAIEPGPPASSAGH